MTEKLSKAMELFEADPAAGGWALRSLLSAGEGQFVRAAAPLLKAQPESRGSHEVLKLLAASDPSLTKICDPDFFSKEEAVELARSIACVEPQLDTKLVRLLPGRGGAAQESGAGCAVERTLELLEAVSKCARIVPALTHLLHDPNPRLRAKAALLMGRRVQNTQLVEGQMQEPDARVRANAIESLWGDKAAAASSILWSAVKDTNNRVVGNALLGLYQARENGVIPRILEMSAASAPLFRATGAWVMGQTADARFLPVLEKLARDLYATVRKNAAKATGLIRDSMGTPENLLLHVLRSEPGDYQSIWIQAFGPDGAAVRGILPSQFVVWSAEKLVTDYKAIESDTPAGVVVGLAVCRDGAVPAVTAALEQKTPEHLWAIAQVRSGVGEGGEIAPAVYLADAKKLQVTMAEPPATATEGVETLAAIQSLLPAILRTQGSRHLILFPASAFSVPVEMEPPIATAIKHGIAIHAMVVGSPSDSLKSICDRTGGFLIAVPDDAGLGEEFRRLYSALTNHYRIQYREATADDGAIRALRVQVYTGQGRGECSSGRL